MIHFATPPEITPIDLAVDLVAAGNTPLIGIDVLYSASFTVNTVVSSFTRRGACYQNDGSYAYHDDWHMPCSNLNGTLFTPRGTVVSPHPLQVPKSLSYTKSFFHPSSGKRFNHLKQARPLEATAATLAALQHLSKRFDLCQCIQLDLVRCRVSFVPKTFVSMKTSCWTL